MRAGSAIAALALILGLASTASGATPPPVAADVLVEGFAFQPPRVTIAAGGSVTWTIGSDHDQHTVTPRVETAFEDSGQLFTGDTFTVTFDEPGTVEYFCSLHPTMVGTVEVSAPPGTTTATPGAGPTFSPTASPQAAEPQPAGESASGLPLLILAALVGLAVVALVTWLARRRT